MSYFLKQFDTNLLQFHMHKTLDGVSTEILCINEVKAHLLPLDIEVT